MITSDYECNDCGFTAKYSVSDSNTEPSCFKCGGDTRRLPEGFDIGESSMRKVTMEDFYAPKKGLESGLGSVESGGREFFPCVSLRLFEILGSPHMN